MSAVKLKLSESLGKLTGYILGFTITSVVSTSIGLYILGYLGWLPF